MRAGALASALDLPLHGDADRELSRLASLESAGPGDLAFVTGRRYLNALQASTAGLVIVPPGLLEACPVDALVAEDPYVAYAAASWLLVPERQAPAGVHPSAVVDESAEVAPDASVGPRAVIGAGSRIGAGARIGAGCLLGERVRIGAGTRLFDGVTVNDDVHLGGDCRVQSGAVIGAEGFGFAPGRDGWRAIHQIGGVRIGDRVQVGANTTIDCGAIEPTVIGDGVILDNQIQIAHNVRIGNDTAIAACTGIAGSTTIGARCLIGGSCNINGHIELADGVTITATAFVPHSIREAGSYGSAMPLQPNRAWRRTFAALGRLDELLRRVRALERRDSSTAPVPSFPHVPEP